GEVLAEIETDKATMEWESPEDGTLTEIYVEEGGKENVGDKIGLFGGEGEEAPKEEEKEKPQKEEEPKAEEEKKEEKAEPKKEAAKKEPEQEEVKPKKSKEEEEKKAAA